MGRNSKHHSLSLPHPQSILIFYFRTIKFLDPDLRCRNKSVGLYSSKFSKFYFYVKNITSFIEKNDSKVHHYLDKVFELKKKSHLENILLLEMFIVIYQIIISVENLIKTHMTFFQILLVKNILRMH